MVLAMKKFIKKLWPEFNTEIMESFLLVAIENDVQPLWGAISNFGACPEILNILVNYLEKNDFQLQCTLRNLSKTILPESKHLLFMILNNMRTKNVFENNWAFKHLFKISDGPFVELILALYMKDSDPIRCTIMKGLSQIVDLHKHSPNDFGRMFMIDESDMKSDDHIEDDYIRPKEILQCTKCGDSRISSWSHVSP